MTIVVAVLSGNEGRVYGFRYRGYVRVAPDTTHTALYIALPPHMIHCHIVSHFSNGIRLYLGAWLRAWWSGVAPSGLRFGDTTCSVL